MEFWALFWGTLLLLSVLIFLVLAVAVTIGGLRDVRELFKSIEAQHSRASDEE